MKIKDKIISIFESVKCVAEICEVTPGAVSQWNIIPSRHQAALLAYAQNHNIKLLPNDFFETGGIKTSPPLTQINQPCNG